MKRITDNLSREVVTVAEGKIAGIVTNAYVSEKLSKVKGWRVSSDDNEADLTVQLSRVVGYGDALTLANESALKPSSALSCPIGAKLFDSMGRDLGVLRDLVFDEKTGITQRIVSSDRDYSPSLVVGVGSNAVVLRAEEHINKAFRRKGAAKPHVSAKHNAITDKTEQMIPEISDNSEGTKFPDDYGFLLGRKLSKNVFSAGEILAKKGDEVTAEIIESARDSGKLVELTVNSRK